jgi:hypothetical protein
MILHANDFGCVPDGRFLERISITAGSAVLNDPDSILRPTDVGKNIAIPGAIDLETTIARLVEHREVRGASMVAGSKELKGTLFDPVKPAGQDEERFLDVHVGRRITVAGADPNGPNHTLVSEITEVKDDGKTIVLADAAATSVSDIRVILNRPDLVVLGDYARRPIDAATIDLGDRTITDGEMELGAPGLRSETANFSSLDLEKPVTIRAAGLLVTTIHSFDSKTQVTLAEPAEREVKEGEGTADVWKTDSRPALELLLAALESLHSEAAEIQFSPGVYDFTRIPNIAHPMAAAIGLQGLKNLTIRGSGIGVTILRLMPQQDLGKPNTHVIETRDCKNLTIRDLSIHGAFLTMASINEQMHGVFLNEGSERIVVEWVRVFQSGGDGIRFLGREANKVRKVWVDGCQLVQNKRSGVAIQRALEQAIITNCLFDSTLTDQSIDIEPSGNGGPTDLVIQGCIINHTNPTPAVTLSGIRARLDGNGAIIDPQPLIRCKFSNNIILGGHVFCTDVHQLSIQNNVVLVTDIGTVQRIPIEIAGGGDSIVITGNLLVNDDTFTKSVISLDTLSIKTPDEPPVRREVRRALVANNLCFARSGIGIQCLSSDDVIIQGNMVVATGDCGNGILIRSESTSVDSISVRDNDVTAQDSGKWKTGIAIGADPEPISHVSIIGNSIRGADRGILFIQFEELPELNKFKQTPLCALNRIADDVDEPLLGFEALPGNSLVVGGAASRGGKDARFGAGRLLAGLGNPEGKVTGHVGDIFQRLDVPQPGEASPSNLYVKTSGDNTNTGWTAK